MSGVLKPDLCVIGAGSAGLSAIVIQALVMLMERARMGGGYLNGSGVSVKASIDGNDLMRHPHTMCIPAMGLETGSTGRESDASVRVRGAP